MWAKGNTDLIDVVVHEDYAADGRVVGREFVRRNMRRFRTGFPDYSVRILTLVASGDDVVVLFEHTGTHQGTLDVYSHLLPDMQDAAAQAMSRILRGAGA